MIAYGPQFVIGQQLAEVDGISDAFLFGSWAARFHGEPGPLPNDIDVLIVGSPDRDDVHDRLSDAARLLHRDVNPTFVSVDRWSDPAADLFLATVVSRPIVAVATPDYAPAGPHELGNRQDTILAMLDAGDLGRWHPPQSSRRP